MILEAPPWLVYHPSQGESSPARLARRRDRARDHSTAPAAVAVPDRRAASGRLRRWAMVAAHHLPGVLVDRCVDLVLKPLDQAVTERMRDSVKAGNTRLLAKPA